MTITEATVELTDDAISVEPLPDSVFIELDARDRHGIPIHPPRRHNLDIGHIAQWLTPAEETLLKRIFTGMQQLDRWMMISHLRLVEHLRHEGDDYGNNYIVGLLSAHVLSDGGSNEEPLWLTPQFYAALTVKPRKKK